MMKLKKKKKNPRRTYITEKPTRTKIEAEVKKELDRIKNDYNLNATLALRSAGEARKVYLHC